MHKYIYGDIQLEKKYVKNINMKRYIYREIYLKRKYIQGQAYI